MRKTIASTAAAASILAATAGRAFGPAIAGAQDDTPAIEQTTIGGVLDGLVTDGTLSQDQRDTVEAALRDAKPGFDLRSGRHGRGHGRPGASILGELGIDREAVRQGLAGEQRRAAIETRVEDLGNGEADFANRAFRGRFGPRGNIARDDLGASSVATALCKGWPRGAGTHRAVLPAVHRSPPERLQTLRWRASPLRRL